MPNVTIYHNPRCSKSRQTLALLEEQGISPEVVEYMNQPPTFDEMTDLIKKLDTTPRKLMRTKEKDYKASGASDPSLSDDALIQKMLQYPKLIERPIVVNGDKAAIGRPPENVLDIL